MALFTVIADYRGGTYIKQLHASDVQSAFEQWARELPDIRGSFIGAATKRKVSAAVREPDDRPVAIDGTENVSPSRPSGTSTRLIAMASL
ncbi:MAG TPA: hypothetical protein VD837_02365 [Terriglobales bacterium]|nr:hypothetical protein [Terriglobales bacterium]